MSDSKTNLVTEIQVSQIHWDRGSLIFSPNDNSNWMYHYAAQATALEFPNFIRVYFTTRSRQDLNGNFESSISYVDCDKNDPTRILYLHNRPLLTPGLPGAFDEHGIMMGEILRYRGKYWLYYIGWQRSATVPYITTLGLALSDDGETFEKLSEGPVVGLSRHIPYGIAKLSILIENEEFRIWYSHYKEWISTGTNFRPNYDIRYASSKNGLDWSFGDICIYPSDNNEALGTPCVRKIDGVYHMWFGYRAGIDSNGASGKYLIGYANSRDGIDWTRSDELMTLSPSSDGWDSEMLCYPNISVMMDKLYLFYSGNSYGKTGFGFARTSAPQGCVR